MGNCIEGVDLLVKYFFELWKSWTVASNVSLQLTYVANFMVFFQSCCHF